MATKEELISQAKKKQQEYLDILEQIKLLDSKKTNIWFRILDDLNLSIIFGNDDKYNYKNHLTGRPGFDYRIQIEMLQNNYYNINNGYFINFEDKENTNYRQSISKNIYTFFGGQFRYNTWFENYRPSIIVNE